MLLYVVVSQSVRVRISVGLLFDNGVRDTGQVGLSWGQRLGPRG